MEKDSKRGVLGQYLLDIRTSKRMSLRDVEEATNISNAYLSQLETGKIEKPSPHVLHELAEVYGVSYELLMQRAGYLNKAKASPGEKRKGKVPTYAIDELTAEEEEELRKYLAFLRSRKGSR